MGARQGGRARHLLSNLLCLPRRPRGARGSARTERTGLCSLKINGDSAWHVAPVENPSAQGRGGEVVVLHGTVREGRPRLSRHEGGEAASCVAVGKGMCRRGAARAKALGQERGPPGRESKRLRGPVVFLPPLPHRRTLQPRLFLIRP